MAKPIKKLRKATERGAGLPRRDLSSSAVPYYSPYTVSYGQQPFSSSTGIIRGGGADWFGPLNPMAPTAPAEVRGRQFDLIPGQNLVQQPRAYELIGFPLMRALADGCDLLRTVIETRKDQLCRLKWTVRLKESVHSKNTSKDIPAAKQAKIDAAIEFFKKPDGRKRWKEWLRVLLEDLFVIDAPTLYKQRNRGGMVTALEYLAGDTIKVVIDDWGRTPFPYDDPTSGETVIPPAFQQVLKGMPAVNYTADELIYKPYNIRSNRIYGYSPVEQIIISVNIILRRQVFLLDYYREGSMPDSVIGLPDGWTPEQIIMFQEWWDTALSGQLAARRRAKFVPSGTKSLMWSKDVSSDNGNKLDEWLARIICFAFSISPQPFMAMMNRATAETSKSSSMEEGIEPSKGWIEELITEQIESGQYEFSDPDLEFAFVEEDETDQQVQEGILEGRTKTGLATFNESRATLGLKPYSNPVADVPMVLTANGYVPIDVNVPGSDSFAAKNQSALDMAQQRMNMFGPPPGASGDESSQDNSEDNNSGSQWLDKTWGPEAWEASAAARRKGDDKSTVGYHGASSDIIDSVRKNGLKIGGDKNVWLAENKSTASLFAETKAEKLGHDPVVFEVNVPKENWDDFRQLPTGQPGHGTASLSHNIPKEWIAGYHTVNQTNGKLGPLTSLSKAFKPTHRTMYVVVLGKKPGTSLEKYWSDEAREAAAEAHHRAAMHRDAMQQMMQRAHENVDDKKLNVHYRLAAGLHGNAAAAYSDAENRYKIGDKAGAEEQMRAGKTNAEAAHDFRYTHSLNKRKLELATKEVCRRVQEVVSKITKAVPSTAIRLSSAISENERTSGEMIKSQINMQDTALTMIAESLAKLAAPKRVVRDKDDRPIGVEPI